MKRLFVVLLLWLLYAGPVLAQVTISGASSSSPGSGVSIVAPTSVPNIYIGGGPSVGGFSVTYIPAAPATPCTATGLDFTAACNSQYLVVLK